MNIKSHLRIGEIASIVFYFSFSILVICLLVYLRANAVVILEIVSGITFVSWMILVISCQFEYKLYLRENDISVIQFIFIRRKIEYTQIKELKNIYTPYRDGSIHKSLKIVPMQGFSIRLNYDRINIEEVADLLYYLKDRTNLQILEQKGYY